jgi:hypothetical protein
MTDADDDLPCIGVFRQRGPVFEMALPEQAVPSGALVGAIVWLDESWQSFRYGRNGNLGSFATPAEALMVFYASKAPPAPPSRITHRQRGRFRRSYHGSTGYACDCYDDGESCRHLYSWESFSTGPVRPVKIRDPRSMKPRRG